MVSSRKNEWAYDWHPWLGCRPVSEGCERCFIAREKARTGQEPDIAVKEKSAFDAPLSGTWKSGAFVFVCAFSDFFIEETDAWRDEAWRIIKCRPDLRFLVLTKRVANIQNRLPSDWGAGYPNLFLGVSAENQRWADERIPPLRGIPASKKFISAEPLLGPLDLTQYLDDIDWLQVGGESGRGGRPMSPEWTRDLRCQCREAGVRYISKQEGSISAEGIPAE